MKFTGRLALAVAPILLAGCGGDAGKEEAGEEQAGNEAVGESAAAASPAEMDGTDVAASPATSASPPPQVAATAAAAVPPASFALCRSCHSVEPGKNGIGPSLHGVFGRQAGSVDGFNYSPALKQSGITWDRTSLDTWLAGPVKMVPGTRMVLAQRDEAQRKAVVDYLEALK